MSISVVTVVLNAAEGLPLTLESVSQQDYKDVELIVVDGGSFDNTAAVLALYENCIEKIVRIEDAGIYFAMNAAINHCKNDYVLFLNAKDTLFDSSTLSRLMACKRDGIDVFFGNHIYVNGQREFFKQSYDYNLSAELLMRGDINHTWLARLPGHQATFMRRELLLHLQFDTTVQICADHDLMMRAHRAGASFQYIDQTVSHYIGGGFSALNSQRLALEWCALYRQYTKNPAAVDRFFLDGAPSPFPPENKHTGFFLSGAHSFEGPYPEHGVPKQISWCHPEGVKIRTPAGGSITAMQLEGLCRIDDQHVTFFIDDEAVGTIQIEQGWFKKRIAFTHQVAPLSVIELVSLHAQSLSASDKRFVGFAISSFEFEGAANEVALLHEGSEVIFSRPHRDKTEPMLGPGWSEQEDDFIWTIGERAIIWMRLTPTVSKLVFRLGGNPFIHEAQQRGLDIAINGQAVGTYFLGNEGPQEIVVADFVATIGELTKIEFIPLKRQEGDKDHRLLGVLLFSLACL